MKQLPALLTMIISLITSVVILKAENYNHIYRKSETKTINLEHFDSINAEMIFDIEVVKSNEEKAIIESNYLAYVEINVKNNVLQIGYMKNKSLQNVKTKIIIYAKNIKSLQSGLGAVVRVKDLFSTQKFYTESGGKIYANSDAENIIIGTREGGFFSGTINTENLVIRADSGSSVKLEGEIKSAKIETSGAAKIDALNTKITDATINADSASFITLSVSKELKASASSMSKIRYKTLSGIKLSANRNSGGTIDML